MTGIDELDVAAVHDVLRGEVRNVLVDFWSPWCAPCRALRPHLHKLAAERSADWRFVAVNTEAHPTASDEFEVRSLPTLVFFRGGHELSRISGGVTLSSVVATLDEFAERSD